MAITPPDPSRIDCVAVAMRAMSRSGALDRKWSVLWCSANQNRWKPISSSFCAKVTVSSRVWVTSCPTNSGICSKALSFDGLVLSHLVVQPCALTGLLAR